MGEHRLDDLEARDVYRRVHVQEHRRVAHQLLDAEVEHHAVAAMQLHRVLRDLEDLLRREHFHHVAQVIGVARAFVHGARGFAQERAHCGEPGRHVGQAQRHGLVLDQDAAALHVVLHVVGGALERRHADAEVLGGLDDLAGPEIDPGLAERVVLDQQMIRRQAHVLEHQLAIVHEAAAHRLVAARDG